MNVARCEADPKCGRRIKRRFLAELEAESEASRIKAVTNGRTKLYPYQCPWCSAWHLTSIPRKDQH